MMRATTIVLLAGLVLFARTQSVLAADTAKESKVESKAQKARGNAPDENVKSEVLKKNSPAKAGKLAARKGGEKSRGTECVLHIDNRTDLVIHQIFVDGELVGFVDAGGDAIGPIACGTHQMYARAFFDDGSNTTWGPRLIECSESGTECAWSLLP